MRGLFPVFTPLAWFSVRILAFVPTMLTSSLYGRGISFYLGERLRIISLSLSVTFWVNSSYSLCFCPVNLLHPLPPAVVQTYQVLFFIFNCIWILSCNQKASLCSQATSSSGACLFHPRQVGPWSAWRLLLCVLRSDLIFSFPGWPPLINSPSLCSG